MARREMRNAGCILIEVSLSDEVSVSDMKIIRYEWRKRVWLL